MTTAEVSRSPRATLSTFQRDPRDQWPEHARRLYDHLVGLYGEDNVLPTLAASWIAHQRSVNTQRAYARGFKVFEEFAREHGAHPMAVKFMLADTFRMHLETTPTWVRVKGGQRGEMVRAGKPYSDASRANALSSASSFFSYLDVVSDEPVKNPFDAVQRPVIDPDYSATEGLTEEEQVRLLLTARDHHQPKAYRPRAYALLLTLYTVCLRIDSLLAARVEDIGYDRGHWVLDVRLKGGARKKKAIPPATYDALMNHLDGRTQGFLFQTATGRQLDEPSVWRLIRSLARRAGLPQADSIHPHMVKHNAITHALARPGAQIEKVQDWADHKDARTTGRYNRRRGLLDDSPGYELAASLAGLLGA
ncbi:tyrosine-type recombinase/integrase [Streptomyces milbemycinicus]|uniref:Tyrosine-type recombinase/integrase n=1 Tax=Streptomyces milbemycinicus TaxID=476552 RepID=A0ABW8M3X1_9ACTN